MLIEIFNACRLRTWTARSTISEVNCKYLPFLHRNVISNNFYSRNTYIKSILLYNVLSFSMKPTLKKVSKYENKFAKLQKKAAEFNFRNQLKQVKKKEFTLEEEDKEVRTIVFDKIFASKRRESFYKNIFFLPRQRSTQTFLWIYQDENKWKQLQNFTSIL